MSAFRHPAYVVLAFSIVLGATRTDAQSSMADERSAFWAARDAVILPGAGIASVRVAAWDSGVDTTLFASRLARDAAGRPLIRGYDHFKLRQDTPMAVLPAELLERREQLNGILVGWDDIDSRVLSPAARAATRTFDSLPAEARAQLYRDMDRWSAYAHGTGVADVLLAGHGTAELVIARMEWPFGSPPVPCWTRELAHREADSMRDLIAFLVESGARVVNMSWGRAEASYRRNLEQCAPEMPADARVSLARYTVDTLRAVLRASMAAAPQVLFVGAAGNAGTTVEAANPATRFSLPNFLLIGAVDRNGAKAGYTNTGAEVTLYANGDRVPSRLPGGAMSHGTGTSIAAPNISNAAAKMLAVDPLLTGAELRALLEQTADTNATGQRVLHPARAVDAARARRK